MRFFEFKQVIMEGEKGRQFNQTKFSGPGYFTVGDSHSNGIGNYGRGETWNALGEDGASAFDTMIPKQIEKIPAGSVVVISAGANDLKANVPIPSIVSQVNTLISLAQSNSLKVFYALPTFTEEGKDKEKRDDLRKELQKSVDVPMIDLKRAGPDGLHLTMGAYARIASSIVQNNPIDKSKINLGNPKQAPGKKSLKDKTKSLDTLVQGPPYPVEAKPQVKALQQALQGLGYSVGKQGDDGRYGPFTAAAVAAFKKDYNIPGKSSTFGEKEFAMLNKLQNNEIAKVRKPSRSNSSQAQEFEIAGLNSIEMNDKARQIAEEFLGRPMNDDEWKTLIQLTTSESSPNQEEMAQIAAVVLNRVRTNYLGGRTVIDIAYKKGQFEPVTGHKRKDGSWSGPHPNFTTPVSQKRLIQILDAYVKYLPSSDDSYLNFTSANPKAYKTEKGRRFLRAMLKAGGPTIGGTVFGTI